MAENEPTWEVFPETYDAITFTALGRTFQFIETKVTIGGSGLAAKWDAAEAPGTDGARITYRGYSTADIDVAWQVYTLGHEITWLELREAVAPKPGKAVPKFIGVAHPLLAQLGLALFVVKGVAIPKRVAPGILELSMKLVQYFPQPKAAAKPKTTGDITSIPIAGALKPKVPPPPEKPSKATPKP